MSPFCSCTETSFTARRGSSQLSAAASSTSSSSSWEGRSSNGSLAWRSRLAPPLAVIGVCRGGEKLPSSPGPAIRLC